MKNNSSNNNILAVAAAGALVGAAVVGAIALSDKENRNKLSKKVEDLTSKGSKAFSAARKKVQELKEETLDKAEEIQGEAKKSIKKVALKNGQVFTQH